MQVLSKLVDKVFMPEWSFRYNCYEVAHTWDPSCTAANVQIGFVVLTEALRMYGSLSAAQFALQLYLARGKAIAKAKKEKETNLKAIEYVQDPDQSKKPDNTENTTDHHPQQDERQITFETLSDQENNNYLLTSDDIKNNNDRNQLKLVKRVRYQIPEVQDKNISTSGQAFDSLAEISTESKKFAATQPKMIGYWERETVIKLLRQSVESWLRSSAFLGFNAYIMFSLFCLCRHLTGKFYYRLISTFPATFGCLLAIQIERPSRRNALAVYVANVASEVLFRMGQSRGYYDGLGDNGIALMFSLSVAYLAYRVKSRGYGRDPTSIALKQLLGKGEEPTVRRESSRRSKSIEELNDSKPLLLNNAVLSESNSKTAQPLSSQDRIHNHLHDHENTATARTTKPKMSSSDRINLLQKTYHRLAKLANFPLKHETCTHTQGNCGLYAAEAFALPFVAGFIGPALLRSLLNPKKFVSAPFSTIWRQLRNGRSKNIAMFCGLFCGGFRAGCCTLRWITGSRSDWHVFAAAAVAGSAALKAPSSTIATYVLWKAIESAYVDLYKKGYMLNPLYVSPWLYALSVNTIFYAGILEPYNVRPSYAKFLERVTQNKIHLINRSLLAVFGTNAFVGFEEFWPDLDPKLCSNEFMETVMLWKLGDK